MICTGCGVDKTPEKFNWKNKAAGRRSSRCKICHKDYRDQHYKDNRDKRLKQAAVRRIAWRETQQLFIIRYLESNPCVDCGEQDIIVLEFDHKEPGCESRVSDLFNYSRKRLVEEIERCEVRCANCHKRRTAIQMNSYRLQGRS